MSKQSKKPATETMPKTVYCRPCPWDDEGSPMFEKNAEDCLGDKDSIRVGVYELVGYATVTNKTEVVRD